MAETDLVSEARALIAGLNQSAQMPDMIKRLADALEEREVDAVTSAIIDAIIGSGGSIDFKVQRVAGAAISALDRVRKG